MKDRAEVCSLSREVLFQPLSTPLQDGLRFFRVPVPAISSACLAAAYRDGLTVFCIGNKSGLGLLYPPVALDVHERTRKIASTRHGAFWLKPVSIFGLLPGYDVYQAFTCVDHTTHSSPRSAVMLADPRVPLRFSEQRCC